MEARELRIGNLVHAFTAGWESEKQHLVIVIEEAKDIHNSHIYYQPIPLTEEWLLKFGFTVVSYSYTNPHYVKGNFGFDACTFKIKLLNKYIKLEYVHQLQNIYFAFTGEELTLSSTNNKEKP